MLKSEKRPIPGLQEITEDDIKSMSCIGFTCLVDMGEVVTQKGSIILTDDNIEKEIHHRVKGVLVKHAAHCWPEWAEKPTDGDTVLIAKYAGLPLSGPGGHLYRLINDLDIKTFQRSA